MALGLGIPPLLVYETTPQVAEAFEGDRLLEWVHGCPAEILLVVARVNAWRAAKWLEDNSLSVGGSPGSSGASESGKLDEGEWRTAEKILKTWKPTIEEIDGSANLVTRLAVQESWRQGVLIYLYMGICGVGSDDVRVQMCVKQVVQLARTVEEGARLEPHLFIPCLIVRPLSLSALLPHIILVTLVSLVPIPFSHSLNLFDPIQAATAARHESHRALLRTKLRASRNEHIWILRGIDFVPVLDYLWHSTGAGGAPVRWDDYVRARVATLPIGT
ncbi:hypothetical protein BDV93DRAFT_122702 [Ceratobasidium sp. AG-I]|nr:hypothetical protein BDV93DRAFT_122702 [Ceratobasidium sp. AG-I]